MLDMGVLILSVFSWLVSVLLCLVSLRICGFRLCSWVIVFLWWWVLIVRIDRLILVWWFLVCVVEVVSLLMWLDRLVCLC